MSESASPQQKSFDTIAMLNTVAEVQSRFILNADTRELFDSLLGYLLELTDSAYGFIGEVLQTPDGDPYLKTHAITNIAWNDETRRFYDENAPRGLEFFNLKSLFGEVMTTGKMVIANDPASDPRGCGIPDGHPDLNAFLGLPVYNNKELVGMMGIANRDGGYSVELADWLSPLLTTYGNIIQSHRIDKQRRQAERNLQSSEEHTRTIIDTVLDGVITIDSRGIIQTFNPAAESIFDYSADEVIGKNVSILMPEPHAGMHDSYIQRHLETGESRIIGIGRETFGLKKDGRRFPIDLAVSPMSAKGEKMFTGIVRDITERKRIEAMKSDFVSTVSHELRTPLTSIVGSLGLVRTGVAGALPEKAETMIDIAYSNAERLVTLINDILDIEKIASGNMVFDMSSLDMGALAADSVRDNAGYAGNYNVSFNLTQIDPSIVARGDKQRLLQVFANLLSNAAKFSPDGGTVDIAVRRVHDTVRVEIADKGPGIPKEYHDRLFERFSQADSSTTRTKGGTGLGLAISKSIIERHFGTIGFETEPGVGTTFWFELPVIADVAGADTDRGSAPRLLVVEDDPDVASVLVALLAQAGFEADTAHTAAEAKAQVAAKDYAAITLDLILPDQDGISLFREWRANPDTRDIPVIVISATAEQGSQVLDGDAVGIIDWIDKPIDTQRMMAAVRTATAQQSERPRILHVEDDVNVQNELKDLVGDLADVVSVGSLRDARRAIRQGWFDTVVLDIGLPDGVGQDLLPLLKDPSGRTIPVIVFSAGDMTGTAAGSINSILSQSHSPNTKLLETIRNCLARARD